MIRTELAAFEFVRAAGFNRSAVLTSPWFSTSVKAYLGSDQSVPPVDEEDEPGLVDFLASVTLPEGSILPKYNGGYVLMLDNNYDPPEERVFRNLHTAMKFIRELCLREEEPLSHLIFTLDNAFETIFNDDNYLADVLAVMVQKERDFHYYTTKPFTAFLVEESNLRFFEVEETFALSSENDDVISSMNMIEFLKDGKSGDILEFVEPIKSGDGLNVTLIQRDEKYKFNVLCIVTPQSPNKEE